MASPQRQIKQNEDQSKVPGNRPGDCPSQPLRFTVSLHHRIPKHACLETHECQDVQYLRRNQEHLTLKNEIWLECPSKL